MAEQIKYHYHFILPWAQTILLDRYIYIYTYIYIYIYIHVYIYIYKYTPKGSLCRPIMDIGPAYVDRCFM